MKWNGDGTVYKTRKVGSIALSIIMILVILFGSINVAYADGDAQDIKIANKTAELVTGSSDRYKVTVEVPGENPDRPHNEIILIMDASDSHGSNWNGVKSALLNIGKQALENNANNNRITLIGFAISDKIVESGIDTYEELE